MSKARESSLKRKISRGTKGREHKEPRIITEFVSTMGKLVILKRSTTGHNSSSVGLRKPRNKRAYYSVIGTV